MRHRQAHVRPGKTCSRFSTPRPVRLFASFRKRESCGAPCAEPGGKKPLSSILIGSRESRQPETHCDRKIFDFRSCRSQKSEYRIQKSETRSEPERRPPNAKPRTFESHSASMATTEHN